MIASVAYWGLISLAAFAGLMIFILLCTPIKLSAQVNTTATPRIRARIGLLGGLISFPIPQSKSKSPPPDKPSSQSAEKQKRSSLSLARLKTLARTGPRLLRGMLKRIKVEVMNTRVIYGFADPSDTGVAFGLLTPLTYSTNALRGRDIILQPNFQGARFEATGAGSIRVTPITLLPALIRFGWSTFIAPKISR